MSRRNLKILIVESYKEMEKLLERALAEDDVEIKSVEPEVAVDKVKEENFDIVVVDWNTCSSAVVERLFKFASPKLGFVVISSYSGNELESRFKGKFRLIKCIAEPLKVSSLRKLIDELKK